MSAHLPPDKLLKAFHRLYCEAGEQMNYIADKAQAAFLAEGFHPASEAVPEDTRKLPNCQYASRRLLLKNGDAGGAFLVSTALELFAFPNELRVDLCVYADAEDVLSTCYVVAQAWASHSLSGEDEEAASKTALQLKKLLSLMGDEDDEGTPESRLASTIGMLVEDVTACLQN